MLKKYNETLIFWDIFSGQSLNQKSGIDRYGRELESALLEQNVAVNHISESALFQKPTGESLLNRFIPSRILNTKIGRIFQLEVLLKNLKYSSHLDSFIFHGLSNFNLPHNRKLYDTYRTVITIHDLIPLIVPKMVSYASTLQLKYCLERILPRVARILCDSNWTALSLIERYPSIKSKVSVIPLGIKPLRLRNFDSIKYTSAMSLLFVSRFEIYKNFELMVKVLEKLNDSIFHVVTDSRGVTFLSQKASKFIRNGSLKIYTSISDKELFDLYRSANVYIHPSWLEGFCLPVAEAMSLGVPIVYREGSAIGEILNENIAIGLNNDNIDDWIQAIRLANRFNFNSKDHFQDSLMIHFKKLDSWSETAKRVKMVYDELILGK